MMPTLWRKQAFVAHVSLCKQVKISAIFEVVMGSVVKKRKKKISKHKYKKRLKSNRHKNK